MVTQRSSLRKEGMGGSMRSSTGWPAVLDYSGQIGHKVLPVSLCMISMKLGIFVPDGDILAVREPWNGMW